MVSAQRTAADAARGRPQPVWLADYGLEGEELTTELLEERVLPQVRTKVGAERQQLLATMVMLGMNRVAVRDGSISAKVMFRAARSDAAGVSTPPAATRRAVTTGASAAA